MNKKDYIAPMLFGLIFLIVFITLSNKIIPILKINDLSTEIFTFSTLLFGLILTSYSILFGVIPSLSKEYREWDVFEDINYFFISCLFFLLITIILSIIYFFVQPYWFFILIITALGINVGFFLSIILLLKDIFRFISQEGV